MSYQPPPFIQTILKAHRIEDYLHRQGHEPARAYGNRIKYLCPLHGPEKEPSFYVFNDKEFQNYKCFGCGDAGDVINLCSALEGISLKEAIIKLAEGLELPSDEDVVHLTQQIEENKQNTTNYEFEDIAFQISRTCYEYLKMTDFDPIEVEFMDRVYAKVDKIIHAFDLQSLEVAYKEIERGLRKRQKEYNKRKEKEERLRLLSQ